MKPFRTLLAITLFFLPFVAVAQSNPTVPPAPDASDVPPGPPVVAGHVPPATPPPPARMRMQRMGQGGPGALFDTPVLPGLGPGLGAWWKNSEIVSKLQLSDEQVKKISQTFLDHKLKLIDLQADLEKQELRLQPFLDVDQPDEGKVGAQIDLITSARGRLEKENALMMLAIRRWLSAEQWKKLQSLQGERGRNVFYFRGGEGPAPQPIPGDLPAFPLPKPPRPE
ncbi:MAG: periplasmic heavy metal sensor [Terriglobia bacterium]